MNSISEAITWAMQEVDISRPTNLRVRDLALEVAEEADRDDPGWIDRARALAVELQHGEVVSMPLLDAGWETLVRGGQKLIRRPTSVTDDFDFATEVAITALNLPVRDANRGASRQRRVLAAELLVATAAHAKAVTPQADAVIRKASADPDEAVRAAVLGGIGWAAAFAPDLAWDVIEKASLEEDSAPGQAATAFALERMAQFDLGRSCSIALAASQRIAERQIKDGAQSVWIRLLLRLYLTTSRQDVRLALIKFTSRTDDFHSLAGSSRAYIAIGNPGSATVYEEQARRNVHDLLHDLWTEAASELDLLIRTQESGATLTDADGDRGRAAGDRMLSIVRELYFGSGLEAARTVPGDVTKLSRFYVEYSDLLSLASQSVYPAMSYQLLEILEPLTEFDPEGVFLLAARSVASAERGGIQVEQMALEVIVRMVERCLGEYAGRVQRSAEWLRALRETVETFARAGWPRAFQLAYRLHEVLV
jgi:hypothetical protein